jgi:two-component system, cell cycle sensor histidine kinase and response regulator CckA
MAAFLENFARKPTLLIVEDEDQILYLIEAVLRRRGFRILSAGCGAEGLRLFFEHASAIDLLMTDVSLPKIPGTELARRAREIRPDLPVVFMSGSFQMDPFCREPFVTGAGYLPKPFLMPQMLEAVEAALSEFVPSAHS